MVNRLCMFDTELVAIGKHQPLSSDGALRRRPGDKMTSHLCNSMDGR